MGDKLESIFIDLAAGGELVVIEGVMGLYDGRSPTSIEGSTADIAIRLGAPVILVVDASGMALSFAAIIKGFASFDKRVNLVGVIANRVGSKGHLELLRQSLNSANNMPGSSPMACGEITLFGGIAKQRDPDAILPARALGLVTALQENIGAGVFTKLEEVVSEGVDIDGLMDAAKKAPPLPSPKRRFTAGGPLVKSSRCRIGIAYDEAFHFYYRENLTQLEQNGACLVYFSPLKDSSLPRVDGVIFGGGYPEIYAHRLAKATNFIHELRLFAQNGGAIYGECGGLMYLSAAIYDREGQCFEMADIIGGRVTVGSRPYALGYAAVTTRRDSILGPKGITFRGHQFRYSSYTPPEDICDVRLAYQVTPTRGKPYGEGYGEGRVLASYVHAHWASAEQVPTNFITACKE